MNRFRAQGMDTLLWWQQREFPSVWTSKGLSSCADTHGQSTAHRITCKHCGKASPKTWCGEFTKRHNKNTALNRVGTGIEPCGYQQHLSSKMQEDHPNHFGDNSKETNWCCGKFSMRGRRIYRAGILAESQTALKLRFNRPDKDFTRPSKHFVTVVINSFFGKPDYDRLLRPIIGSGGCGGEISSCCQLKW